MSSKLNLLIGGLVGSTTMSGILLVSPWALADTSTVSTATVTIPTSCSMTANVDSEHTASLINGIYSGGNDYYPNGIGKTTLTAFCNDASGFAIYAVGFSGDEYGVTNMIGTNTGTTIPTGTATSGANSQWAMKLAKVTDATAYNPANMTITNGYDDYSAVPNDYEKVASFSSATDQTLGAKLTTTYAAYISNTQPADTYTGKVKYTMVHPASEMPETPAQPVACDGGNICYSPGPSSVTDSMGDQSITSSATSAELWASNFKREGYGFAGWSDKYNWTLGANDASGNGTGANTGYHIYGPNQTIEFTAGQYDTEGLSLYAVWVPSAGSLQNWSGCSSLAQGAVTALTDQRDNNTYAVAKLADGKCWMIENLRLDNTNSDNTTGALAQGYGTSATYGNFIGLANPETENYNDTDPPVANTLYKSDGSGDIKGVNGATQTDIGTTNEPYARMPRFRNDNTNTNTTLNPNTTVANMTGADQNIYSYGNWYSWSAALANTIYYSSATATDADGKTSETVNTSLCPAGWKLPRGGNKSREATNDFWSLIVTGLNNGTNPANYSSSTTPYYSYSSSGEAGPVDKKLRTFPNNFVRSGYVNGSSVVNRGSSGFYWSATASNYSYAHYFYFSSTFVRPGTFSNLRRNGSSVRCVVGS